MRRLQRVLSVVFFGAVGCQAIAGIEERKYDPLEGGVAKVASPLCTKYCNEVIDNCTDPPVYSGSDTCLGICNLLDAGDVEKAGNTASCREGQASLAGIGEGSGPAGYCQKAGPGGGGVCGASDCESYCQLYTKACGDLYAPLPDCEKSCEALRRAPEFDSRTTGDYMGDTLDCRLVHVSAATVLPKVHCEHARLVPPTGPCADDATIAPDCADYCRINLVACGAPDFASDGSAARTPDRSVYESLTQCMDVCKALPPGLNGDQGDNGTASNTVGCRKYHSYNAIVDPPTHCAHSGPGGDGMCGVDNCESYCILIGEACKDSAIQHFGVSPEAGADIDIEACKTECRGLDGAAPGSGYAVLPAPTGNNVQCRLLKTAQAFEMPAACEAALGEAAPCK